jgi:diguanylate cyclase (GGDEF)-like protein
MPAAPVSPSPPPLVEPCGWTTALDTAQQTLQDGDTERAHDQASAVLGSVRGLDRALEARTLAFLAHCDRLSSRLRRGAEAARRAAQLYEELGDMRGEANALTTLSHLVMLLGRNDEAVEAALLAVQLCDMQGVHPQSMLAYNCLGLAYSWAGDHDRADELLERAASVAQRCEPALSSYQPRLNQMWVEASRLLEERYQNGQMQSLARLQSLSEECDALEQAGLSWHVMPGMRAMRRTISLASKALLKVWQGEHAAAQEAIDGAAASLPATLNWLHAFVHWCQAEQAWAAQDWARAQSELTAMREIAIGVEHEQLACRAHLLLVQVYERQGRHTDAALEYRDLQRRQRRVVSDGLGTRETLVSWRLNARLSERHLQQALVQAQQFERWSLEDPLTGLANRRRFEQTLARRLDSRRATVLPLWVAMVDVDRFKSVNDRYSHQVGDQVLKAVAGLMAQNVRDSDLPARWAGDEFVILFGVIDEPQAQDICQRIGQAVAAFAWDGIAPGLHVTVSLGLAQAREGESAEAVLRRSDEAMYRVKGQR